MTRNELSEQEAILNVEYGKRLRLGGYSADAECIKTLTGVCLGLVRHVLIMDKSLEKLNRDLIKAKLRK